MAYGVGNEVADVVVDEGVNGLPAAALRRHHTGASQDPEVLGHEGLAYLEVPDELVDAARPLGELGDDRQPGRGGQDFEELACDPVRLGHRHLIDIDTC